MIFTKKRWIVNDSPHDGMRKIALLVAGLTLLLVFISIARDVRSMNAGEIPAPAMAGNAARIDAVTDRPIPIKKKPRRPFARRKSTSLPADAPLSACTQPALMTTAGDPVATTTRTTKDIMPHIRAVIELEGWDGTDRPGPAGELGPCGVTPGAWDMGYKYWTGLPKPPPGSEFTPKNARNPDKYIPAVVGNWLMFEPEAFFASFSPDRHVRRAALETLGAMHNGGPDWRTKGARLLAIYKDYGSRFANLVESELRENKR